MILEPLACLFCFVGLLKRRCLLKECLLFNLPVPVTSKRLAAAFFVFNFGILIPFRFFGNYTQAVRQCHFARTTQTIGL